jgi:hypothetical protein
MVGPHLSTVLETLQALSRGDGVELIGDNLPFKFAPFLKMVADNFFKNLLLLR